jgi:hypothetical protein
MTTAHDIQSRPAWDIVRLNYLWKESGAAVRRTLQHLSCHGGEWESASSVGEYVEVSNAGLSQLVSKLEQLCRERYGRDLPFERQSDQGGEYYRMSEDIAAFVYEIY